MRRVGETENMEGDSLEISISECPSPSAGDRVSESNSSDSNSSSSSSSSENVGINGSVTDRRSDYGVSSVSSDGMEENRGESSRGDDEPEECKCNNYWVFNILFLVRFYGYLSKSK